MQDRGPRGLGLDTPAVEVLVAGMFLEMEMCQQARPSNSMFETDMEMDRAVCLSLMLISYVALMLNIMDETEQHNWKSWGHW